MSIQSSQPQADPAAVQVLNQVTHQLNPLISILLGSRARGDWRPDSDLDLLFVTPQTQGTKDSLRETIDSIASQAYSPQESPDVQIIQLNPQDFNQSLESINGIAARACREGIIRVDPNYSTPQWNPNQISQEAAQASFHQARSKIYLRAFQSQAHIPLLQMPASMMLYDAYREALLAASCAANIEFRPKASLPELAQTVMPSVKTDAIFTKTSILEHLETVKANGFEIPTSWEPFTWESSIPQVQKELDQLTKNIST